MQLFFFFQLPVIELSLFSISTFMNSVLAYCQFIVFLAHAGHPQPELRCHSWGKLSLKQFPSSHTTFQKFILVSLSCMLKREAYTWILYLPTQLTVHPFEWFLLPAKEPFYLRMLSRWVFGVVVSIFFTSNKHLPSL